ncbi:hypothetical protein PTKIN_Ptkin02bG0011000 [Pterospermum kingtungense]
MARWDELNNFFMQTGAKITFGLNALIGRKKSNIEKGYNIDSYEFGNRLCRSGIGARVEAKQYGKDVITLKNLVKELNPDPKTQPKVLGPSDDPNLITKIQDPFYLNQVAQTYKRVSKIVKKFGPLSGAWVFEIGRTSDNGHKDVSPTFADDFAINIFICLTCCFVASALLWHRLMGSNVLSITQKADPNLRVYAHCAKKKPRISLLFINLSKDRTSNITLLNDPNTVRHNLKSRGVMRPNFEFKGYQNREEYHLTPLDGDIQSDIVLLNDFPLNPTDSLDIPTMDPQLVDAS